MARSYIKLFLSWAETTSELTDAEKGRLVDAMIAYARGDPYQMPGNERFVFPVFKSQIDRDSAAYEEICDKRKQAGAKGGRQKQANASNCYQEQAKPSKASQEEEEEEEKEKEKEKGYYNTPRARVEPDWNPDGTQVEPEVRLGKGRLGKVRGDKGERNPDGTQVEPPSLEDVRRFMDEYASGIGANIDTARASDRFWNHQQAKGWKVQDWQPLARNWIEEDAQRQRTAVQSNPALAYDQRDSTDYSGHIIDLSEYADDE